MHCFGGGSLSVVAAVAVGAHLLLDWSLYDVALVAV